MSLSTLVYPIFSFFNEALHHNPLRILQDANQNISKFIYDAQLGFSKFDLPYRIDDWTDSTGLNVDESTTIRQPLYLNGQGADIFVCILFATLFVLLRTLFDRLFVRLLSRRYKIKKRIRFSECLFFFFYYTAIFCQGICLILYHKLSWPFENLFFGYPQRLYTFELKLYLSIQTSFYLSALYWVVFIDEKRKDHRQMCAHHLITIILILYSQFYNYRNYSILFLVLHDFSDIQLYLTKTFVYFVNKKSNQISVSFTLFAISFFFSRIIYYPITVQVQHTYTIPLLGEYRWDNVAEYYIGRSSRTQVTILMSCLYFLQCVQFFLILKLLYRELCTREMVTDSRSDDEDEEKDERERKINKNKESLKKSNSRLRKRKNGTENNNKAHIVNGHNR